MILPFGGVRVLVYITRALPEELLQCFPTSLQVLSFPSADRPIPRLELLQKVRGVSGIISLLTEKIDAEVFEAAGQSLKIVANMAVGFDNIDLVEARKRSIIVTNTPDVLTETTADLIFGLLLATARRIPEAEQNLRQGKWTSWSPMWLTGQDVYGATIGIIGMGRIAKAVAARARGFGMKILYTGRRSNPDVEKQLPCRFVSFETLLKESDFIVPLVPGSTSTHHLIGKKELAMMKPTAILINASRGTVVDEDALYEALYHQRIWGAGLDVYVNEPIPPTYPLLQLKNVVLLPHIGSASIQTRLQMARLAIDNVIAVLTGKPPLTPVS